VGGAVQAPDGRTWSVRRRWLHRPDWRAPDPDVLDVADASVLGFDTLDGLGAFVAGIAIVVLLIALLVLALPAILFVAGLVVALAGVAARLVAIRQWTIEARTAGKRLEWQARSWRRSGRVRDDVAAALARGETEVRPDDAV
jgi:hypothetical protein